MTILRFNDQALAQELGRLFPSQRTAFAAAAAERLLPAYASFTRRSGRGNLSELAALVDHLWMDLEGRQPGAELDRDIELCMSLIPEEDPGPRVPGQASAEDAASAVAYALRSRNGGDVKDAVWTAQCAYEALDRFVIQQESIDTNEAGAEERVLSHPLVQAELLRQQRDLRELGSESNLAVVAERLRARARAESETFFGVKLADLPTADLP